MPGGVSKSGQLLRHGYSTGACAAAAAKAAFLAFDGCPPSSLSIPVLFPDGQRRDLKLSSAYRKDSCGHASIVKDAGDDPDVTDKATIRASLSAAAPSEATDKDYTLECGLSIAILRGASGVGFATRQGLSCEQGKWAFNPVPRNMIAANLLDAGFGRTKVSCALIEMSVDNGAEIARRTLNPLLGVMDGISILGTTGFVVPYSNAAYIDTVKALLKGAAAAGVKDIVLCTGASTLNASRKISRAIPEISFIRIADFIKESISSAKSAAFNSITISCMEGKLLKYALGMGDTHAWRNSLDVQDILQFIPSSCPDEIRNAIAACATVREAVSMLPPQLRMDTNSNMASSALASFTAWAPSMEISLQVFAPDGSLLLTRTSKEASDA